MNLTVYDGNHVFIGLSFSLRFPARNSYKSFLQYSYRWAICYKSEGAIILFLSFSILDIPLRILVSINRVVAARQINWFMYHNWCKYLGEKNIRIGYFIFLYHSSKWLVFFLKGWVGRTNDKYIFYSAIIFAYFACDQYMSVYCRMSCS